MSSLPSTQSIIPIFYPHSISLSPRMFIWCASDCDRSIKNQPRHHLGTGKCPCPYLPVLIIYILCPVPSLCHPKPVGWWDMCLSGLAQYLRDLIILNCHLLCACVCVCPRPDVDVVAIDICLYCCNINSNIIVSLLLLFAYPLQSIPNKETISGSRQEGRGTTINLNWTQTNHRLWPPGERKLCVHLVLFAPIVGTVAALFFAYSHWACVLAEYSHFLVSSSHVPDTTTITLHQRVINISTAHSTLNWDECNIGSEARQVICRWETHKVIPKPWLGSPWVSVHLICPSHLTMCSI